MITIRQNKYGYSVLDENKFELGRADITESVVDDHIQIFIELLAHLNIKYKLEDNYGT